MDTTITITYDSIFDIESYITKNVGTLTPVLYEWFFERVEPVDIKQCSLTNILRLLTSILSSYNKSTVNIVTYGIFDDDLINSVITLFDTLYQDKTVIKFIDKPTISEYNIVTNIMEFLESTSPPNDNVVLYYKASVHGIAYGKEEIDLIEKTLTPTETIPVDEKHFKGKQNGI